MRAGLQTHFGTPIGVDVLHEVKAFGYVAGRCDVMGAPPAATDAVLAECRVAGIAPLCTVDSLDQIRYVAQRGVRAVEWRNEPDIHAPGPTAYSAELATAAQVAADCGVRLWVGAVSNPHDRGMNYLRGIASAVASQGPHVGVSFHRYGTGIITADVDLAFSDAHSPFRSRADEVAAIRKLFPSRALAVTEFGWSTNVRVAKTPWWLRWLPGTHDTACQWTEAQQHDLIAREWAFWAAQDVDVAFLYQINCAPAESDPANDQNWFGIRVQDVTNGPWRWKAAANAIGASHV